MTFSADAYLNEMGITSPTFPMDNLPNGSADRLERCDELKGDPKAPEDNGDGVGGVHGLHDLPGAAAPRRDHLGGQRRSGRLLSDRLRVVSPPDAGDGAEQG